MSLIHKNIKLKILDFNYKIKQEKIFVFYVNFKHPPPFFIWTLVPQSPQCAPPQPTPLLPIAFWNSPKFNLKRLVPLCLPRLETSWSMLLLAMVRPSSDRRGWRSCWARSSKCFRAATNQNTVPSVCGLGHLPGEQTLKVIMYGVGHARFDNTV